MSNSAKTVPPAVPDTESGRTGSCRLVARADIIPEFGFEPTELVFDLCWLVYVLLRLHGTLLAWSAVFHSPVNGEVPALAAGIRHWQYGQFDLYRVNPPRVRTLAALPILWPEPATNWNRDHLRERPNEVV